MWDDRSITPVRGQVAWLIPQPELNYGVIFNNISMLARRDGIVIQDLAGGDMRGYNNTSETPDLTEATSALAKIASLYARTPIPL